MTQRLNADDSPLGFGVALPATPQNERFTVVVFDSGAWRTAAGFRIGATFTGRALEGFDAGRLYLECPLEMAREIARAVKALNLTRGWAIEPRQMAYRLCENCYGPGLYRWGACINGKPPVHSGPCFRCGSKGFQDADDARRNYGYDMHRKVY